MSILSLAANKGHGNSAFRLGEIYEEGFGDIVKDQDIAAHWYNKGAEAGHEISAIRLGALKTVSANKCLSVRRSTAVRENVTVFNTCNFPITVKLCKQSKTDAVMELLGSWVSTGNCEFIKGEKGRVTDFFFATPSSADIWKLLSDARFEVTATRLLP